MPAVVMMSSSATTSLTSMPSFNLKDNKARILFEKTAGN